MGDHRSKGEVALVCMPWNAASVSPLSLAILKPYVEQAGFVPVLHHLNIRFAQRLGFDIYEKITLAAISGSEWFFSQALFGPSGLGELQNGWNDIKMQQFCHNLVEALGKVTSHPEELCSQIANVHVPAFIDGCVRDIDWGRYIVVGFTSTFSQSLASLLLAKRIKECHPHVRIVFGGANVDSEMGVEFMRGFEWVDYVVHGEGERSFPELLDVIASGQVGKRIPGVSMRRGGELVPGDKDAMSPVELNATPIPDYSDYVDAFERAGFRSVRNLKLYFESSRGCWWGAKHQCTFCGLNGSRIAYRRKAPDRVYTEIMQLSKKHGCFDFAATDNIIAPEAIKLLLPKLAEANMGIHIFYEVKANLSQEQLRAFAAAGMRDIQPGIESLNTRILQIMHKGVTAIQNIQLLKWCKEYGITPSWNLIYGFPGESSEDYRDLPGLFRLLSHLCPPGSMGQVVFHRFSPYFSDKERFGLTLTPREAYRHIFPRSRVDLGRIAYHFDGEWEGKTDPESYIKDAKEAWHAWKELRESKSIRCACEVGPEFLIIHDNRPAHAGALPKDRRVELDEQTSAVYLFCDENHSFQSICKMMRETFGRPVDEQFLRESLEQLVAQGLMFQEGNRYLSLATQNKRQPLNMRQVISQSVSRPTAGDSIRAGCGHCRPLSDGHSYPDRETTQGVSCANLSGEIRDSESSG